MASHIERRKFLATLGGASAWPLAARGQQPAMTAAPTRVGLLTVSPPTPAMLNALREGMREHGYVEGQNLSIDVRWPRGSTEEISALAVDLANANLDVILAWATPSVLALQRATSTVPIVMVSVGDPVGLYAAGLRLDAGARWRSFERCCPNQVVEPRRSQPQVQLVRSRKP
jgi:putative tryptophan/tyrosine transport system substrate-binding protein